MNISKNKKVEKRGRRHGRIRAKVCGTKNVPRVSVYRSSKYIYGQLIDDDNGITIASITDVGLKGKTKTERAKEAGGLLAKNAKEKKISKVVFDRGGFLYTGRVKAFAEGAREGGLKF